MRASEEPVSPPSGPRTSRLLSYGALVALLWLARGALVLSLCDVFFYGEELAKGAAGKAILAGIDLDHTLRGYLLYEGGGFVVSHFDALAFALVGANILALKLVALGFATAVLIAGMLLAEQLFDRRAALFFGLLFVFAPSGFQRLSLLALGIHFEALVFVALALWWTARLCAASEMRPRDVALLGVICGFGCYFSYSSALAVAYCAVALWVRRPRETLRATPAGLLGFALGFGPWLWTYSRVGEQVFDIHGQGLLEGEERGVFDLLASHARAIADGGSADAFGFLLLGLTFVVAILLAFRRATPARWRSAWLAGFVVLYGVVYATTGLAEERMALFFHVKRLSQPWFFATIVAAAALSAGVRSPRDGLRKLAWATLVLWVGAGAWGTIDVLRAGRPGQWGSNWQRLRHTRGYAWTAYLKNIEPRLDGDWRERLSSLAPLGADESGHFDPVLAAQLLRAHYREIDLELLVEAAPPERRDAFLHGAGAWWRQKYGRDVVAQRDALVEVPEPWRAALTEAIGRQALPTFVNPDTVRRAIALGRRGGLDDGFFRGVGYRLPVSLGADFGSGRGLALSARPLVFHPELFDDLVGPQESEIVEPLRKGFDRAVVDRSL